MQKDDFIEEEKQTSGVNLTVGPVLKGLIKFFLPIAAGTLFQQLYNAVDAFVVSYFVGTEALAAVGGSPANVSNLVISFFVALTSGCAVVIAQLYGSKRYGEIKSAVKTSYIFCFFTGLIVGAVVILFSPFILTVMKTTPEAYDGSLLYQRIYFLGTVLLLVYNMGSGILRAIGNSRYPFICLFVSCAINIIFDILFVAVFKLGIAGVAWATILAELVSAVMITVKLMRGDDLYKLSLTGSHFSFPLLKQMLAIGIPSGIQASMYGISNIILQVGVNELGYVTVASWSMSGKVDGVYWAVTNAFGTAITTYVGQNYGAKKYDRVKETSRRGLAFLMIATALISTTIMLGGKYVLALLTKDEEVIKTTYQVMTYFVPVYVLWSFIEVYSGVLRGIGDTLIPSLIQALFICVLRIIWVYTAFKTYHTLFVLSLSYPISWLATDIAIFIYYQIKIKKLALTNQVTLAQEINQNMMDNLNETLESENKDELESQEKNQMPE